MNTDLTSLKPALVWKHFAAMTQIPRPSFHEEKIRRYVLDVARSLGLECRKLYAEMLRPEAFALPGILEQWYPTGDLHKMYVVEIVNVWRR